LRLWRKGLQPSKGLPPKYGFNFEVFQPMANLTHGSGQFFSGTSGIVLPVPNKQAFPEEFRDKSRLAYYASLFNSLEVNSSFYKVPMAATVKRWASEVPEGFTFTFKLFKGVTHNKASAFDESVLRNFMKVICQAGDKKACLLIQFPRSNVYNIPQLKKLLLCIQKLNTGNGWKVCFEFRHASWYRKETYELLASRQAAIVIHDMPSSTPPSITPWTEIIYLRFHGVKGDYKGSYTDSFLQKQASMAKDWMATGHTVYVYFNNTIGDAVKNLMVLNRYMEKA